jgi:hypothetical protein
MTSQGAGPALDATKKIEAEQACLLFGNTRIEEFEKGQEELAKIKNGDNAAYKYIDFKDGATKAEFRVKSLKNGGSISLRLDQPWKKQIGWANVPAGDSGNWQNITIDIEPTEGVHAVWLHFFGENELFELDWFRFY